MLEGGIITDEKGEVIDVAEVRKAWQEWGETIEFLLEWENKTIAPPTLAEYNALPGIMIDARRIVQEELAQRRKAKEQQR